MDVPTPHIRVRRSVLTRNIARMARYVETHGLKLRPHTKTHKSRLVARMQRQAGAAGLTTAKAGEAQVMADVCEDVLIAYPALDPWRAEQVAMLARRLTVRVAIDSIEAADALAAAAKQAGTTVGILVDLDVGMHRTGVQSPAAALELGQHVEKLSSLRLDGLFCYPGHIRDPNVAQPPRGVHPQSDALRAVAEVLSQTLYAWSRSGLNATIVSGGSTPTAFQSHLVPQLTEIRPGTYVYNDMNIVHGGFCTLDDCAAAVVSTVVSDAVPGKVIIDAGSKTLTSDRNSMRADAGFGYICEWSQAKIVRLTEEHGEVDVSQCENRPRLGQRVHVIPNHICPCINLHDFVYLVEDDGSIEQIPVDARGKVA